ncbi:SpoIIE family protein phosphatase [Streptomyces sp. NPDC047081]|uniref:ATP-binding SpoIIE family protein phosphatase n=1 Tax=Streptomyces sp. NPDC047081 TaxID=3154706 RepID=UPI0034022084
MARVARELAPRADELIAEVARCLRREVPELWIAPDLARMTSENIAEHVVGVLTGLELGIEPNAIEPPPGDVERARRLARHGTPVTAMLRAHRLGQGVVLDRLLAEVPRLTDDGELISATSRRMIEMATGYVDRASEQGVLAFQEERDRRLQWRLSVVNEAGLRIGTTLDIARTTQELADLAAGRIADSVTVDLLDSVVHGHDTSAPGPPVLRRMAQGTVAEGVPDQAADVQELHTCPAGSPAARALATGQPSRYEDGNLSTMVVPLTARGTTLGVARFSRHRTPYLADLPGRFNDEDLLLAQEISARAAVAVDNARHYTHAQATALTLQRSLLPRRTAEQSAVEVACRYLPAGARVGVGGDWYDVIPLSGARVALVVGDVVGHGIHAAATMGRLRTAVRTLADIDLPPDELLTHLDDVVIRLSAEASGDPDAEETVGDIGATCLYAVYDPVAGRCSLARAGHVLPAVVSRDGAVDLLDLPPGPPLGLGGLPFEAAEIDLPEGSLLALYTDGLIEARDHDVEAGVTLLRQALAQPAASLETACDTVLQALLPADRPHDDVALLLARTRTLGDGQVAAWDVDADPAAVSGARSSAVRQLTAWGLEELDFTAELVISELVTNAIRYGRPPIRLRLIHDRGLLCEVSDAGSTTPHLRRARTFDEGGRGLLLVAQLAEHWGTRHARQGKTVWAELNEGEHAGFPDLTSLLQSATG